MKKIVILNYETAEVLIFNYDETLYPEYNDFYNAMNATGDYHLNDAICACMITDLVVINTINN